MECMEHTQLFVGSRERIHLEWLHVQGLDQIRALELLLKLLHLFVTLLQFGGDSSFQILQQLLNRGLLIVVIHVITRMIGFIVVRAIFGFIIPFGFIIVGVHAIYSISRSAIST